MDQDPEEGRAGDGELRDEEPNPYHRPVMADEVVELLRPLGKGIVVDATFGGGGHTRRIVEELGVQMIAIDRDPEALVNASGLAVTPVQGDFRNLERLLDDLNVGVVAGVLFDFGVSGHQVDEAGRGFSYRREGPLDMRMDAAGSLTAGEIVNGWDVEDLARVLRDYGEEPNALRIARAIVRARPLETTTELATVVAGALPAPARRRGHPARRTFQGLRIAVNDELAGIAAGLDAALSRLRPEGRCVAISYHSLEDRIVKRRFAAGARGCTCPPELPVCACGGGVELRVLTRHPLRPGPDEIARNPRARSARLRAAEKVAA